jgi:hypothetical protein
MRNRTAGRTGLMEAENDKENVRNIQGDEGFEGFEGIKRAYPMDSWEDRKGKDVFPRFLLW